MRVDIYHGDCIEILALLAADSVDSVVTDPPYHLTAGKPGGSGAASLNPDSPAGRSRIGTGFMGKAWDGGDIASDPATWIAVLRVLKPGGHLLAFGGTRTWHRQAVAIEDAGFEIRDTIMWLYGSGFPKSLDVAKAMDKAAGVEREVVGTEKVRDIRNGHGRGQGEGIHAADRDGPVYMERELTEPATPQAKQWQGWGTALKPAHEPILMARKPLSEKTVVSNVLAHGTGAINIDASRVGHVTVADGNLALNPHLRGSINGGNGGTVFPTEADRRVVVPNAEGRFPANVVHDGSDEVLEAFAVAGERTSGAPGIMRESGAEANGNRGSAFGVESRPVGSAMVGYGDTGSAARFFKSVSDDPSVVNRAQESEILHNRKRSAKPNRNDGYRMDRATSGEYRPDENGRFPANVMHDGSDEVLDAFAVAGDRPGGSWPAQRGRGGISTSGHAGQADLTERKSESGSAARFYYAAKASAKDRNGSRHPTVKPIALLEYLVRLVTPPGGTVLDPFAGSGTTARAAVNKGFSAIVIEQDDTYVADIANRFPDGIGDFDTEAARPHLYFEIAA